MSAFRDSRVFLCRPDDSRLAVGNAPSVGYSEQSADGPLLVVLGRDADDFACAVLAHSLGIRKQIVTRFRDGDAVTIEVRATKTMRSYGEGLEELVKCKHYDTREVRP